MSGAALETLAIVAYKQPISRAQIASIRGVDPDGVLRTLQARGYITEVGRDTGPGQAILFGTTPSFLEKLGLDSLADLPPIAEFVPGADVVEALEHGLRVDAARTRCRPTTLSRRSGSSGPPRPPQLPQGERLQKVLAVRRVGEPAGLRGADRRRTGDRQRRGRGARPPGRPRARSRRGRRRAGRACGRASCTTCSTSRPASSRPPATPQGRPTVVELVPAEPRVFPVGRLDVDTEGLLLLTNDGELAHRVDPPEPRRREGVPRRGRGRQRRPGQAARSCARASSSTTA